MKRTRIFLSAAALLIAAGGAFASQYLVAETGYKFIAAGNPQCQPSITCDGVGFMCKDSGVQLWRKEQNGTCQTTPLQRSTP